MVTPFLCGGSGLSHLKMKNLEFPDDAKSLSCPTTLDKHKEYFSQVSILPILSKFYENLSNVQITECFYHHFNIFLSA